jgi:hypothetical protein
MYITVITETKTSGQQIKFQNISSSTKISLKEILKQFGITKIDNGKKIWIKRKGHTEYRKTEYNLSYAILDIFEHDGSTISIVKKRPPAEDSDSSQVKRETDASDTAPVDTPPVIHIPPTKETPPKQKREHHGPPLAVKQRMKAIRNLRLRKLRTRKAEEEKNRKK